MSVLGAHVDGNFFTLLWSDQPGLQVLNPDNTKQLTPDFILNMGMPLIGAGTGLTMEEEQWATVDVPAELGAGGYFLFTIGNGWMRSGLVKKLWQGTQVKAPVLHSQQGLSP